MWQHAPGVTLVYTLCAFIHIAMHTTVLSACMWWCIWRRQTRALHSSGKHHHWPHRWYSHIAIMKPQVKSVACCFAFTWRTHWCFQHDALTHACKVPNVHTWLSLIGGQTAIQKVASPQKQHRILQTVAVLDKKAWLTRLSLQNLVHEIKHTSSKTYSTVPARQHLSCA